MEKAYYIMKMSGNDIKKLNGQNTGGYQTPEEAEIYLSNFMKDFKEMISYERYTIMLLYKKAK